MSAVTRHAAEDLCSRSAPGERLSGTAPVATSWLAVEHPGPWPSDAPAGAGPVFAELVARLRPVGTRVQLIRGRHRTAKLARVYVATTQPHGTSLRVTTVDDPAALLEIEPIRFRAGQIGEPVSTPLLLVCTHGKRDRCCAIHGRDLLTRLRRHLDPHLVWECSHLGGHRFAPTIATLPTGYLYGRVTVTTALKAYEAACRGDMSNSCCRGRSTWHAAGQVAELAVRQGITEWRADVLTVGPRIQDMISVRHDDGRCWEVRISPDPTLLRPVSCGATPTATTSVGVVSVEESPHVISRHIPAG